jgi:hypothetical protein
LQVHLAGYPSRVTFSAAAVPSRRPGWWFRAGAAACLLVATACGSTGSQAGTQPRAGTSGFGAGVFNDLPQDPGAAPAGPVTHRQGRTTRTFIVHDAIPQEVAQRLADAMRQAQWTTVAAPHRFYQIWRARYRRNGQQLLVTVSPAPALDLSSPSQSNDVQYSLVLGDPGVSIS